ncbi:MAG: hypothetical protein COA73_03185 [Candidatus Hydrogenedentota bacterium]|nr:MAG: hypothetical protein COA73_03185 [Candidatus Hydrogenedentota bacterium]
MRNIVMFVLVLVSWGQMAFGVELPPELAHLESLSGDEKIFVEAARELFVEQKRIISEANTPSSSTPADEVEAMRNDFRHQLALAETMWKYVLSYYPNNARANNYYGEYLYDYTSQKEVAVNYWRKASTYDKSFGNSFNNLGIHYFHNGQVERGNNYLERALEVDPKNPDFNFNIAQMYLNHFDQLEKILKKSRKRIYKDAMKYSQKAVKYAPDDFELLQDYAVNFFAAVNFDVKADWSKAAQAWQAAREYARHDQDIFFTHLNEGRAWLRAENYQNAVSSIEAALKVRGNSVAALQLLEQAKEKL